VAHGRLLLSHLLLSHLFSHSRACCSQHLYRHASENNAHVVEPETSSL
jgi:hypothetical protein